MSQVIKEIEVPALEEKTEHGSPVVSPTAVLPLIGNVKVRVVAQIGSAELTVHQLTELKQGSTVSLEQMVDQPVDLLVEGKLVARGQLVAVDDQFGVKILTPIKMC